MSAIFLFAGLILAGLIIVSSIQLRSFQLRMAAISAAAVVLIIFFVLASFRSVDENQIGLVSKKFGFTSLAPGKIIATAGEKGPQAEILPPGWHLWYWPFIYDIEYADVVEIEPGTVGMLTTSDGQPLPPEVTYAPPWEPGTEGEMIGNAEFFLGGGNGYKGPQTTVLSPSTYRFNKNLFKLEIAPVLTIEKAEVGVVKSNVGEPPAPGAGELAAGERRLVEKGQRGIWKEPLIPRQYYEYSNTKAYQVTKISTMTQIIRYTTGQGQQAGGHEETAINVITSDGFDFPVDVRIQYEIQPQDAPLLVASVGDDQDGLRAVMNSRCACNFPKQCARC